MIHIHTVIIVLSSSLSHVWLCDPVDCSPPDSSVHGILQATILEWVAIPLSRGSSRPRDQTRVSCTTGRFFTIWATREALLSLLWLISIISRAEWTFQISSHRPKGNWRCPEAHTPVPRSTCPLKCSSRWISLPAGVCLGNPLNCKHSPSLYCQPRSRSHLLP